MKTFRFYLPEQKETIDDAREVQIAPICNVRDMAEKAADYYHARLDGWEDTWPVEIAVIFEGQEHRFSVDREYRPEFEATPLSVPVPVED